MKVRLRLLYGDDAHLFNRLLNVPLREPSREEQLVVPAFTAKSQGNIIGQLGELKVVKKLARVRVSSHKTGLASLVQG